MTKLKIMFIILHSVAVFGCSNKDGAVDKSPDVLAVVGPDTIRTQELMNLLEKQNRSKVDVQNEKVRQDLLNNLVQGKLIYFYGLENKLNELNEVKIDVTTRRDEIFYEKVLRTNVYYPMISDKEVAAYYDKLKTEVRVQQILIGYKNPAKVFLKDVTDVRRNKNEARLLADSLHSILKSMPQMFDTLAEIYSDDYTSKYLRGDAGFMRWGARPSVENTVFNLSIGEIS